MKLLELKSENLEELIDITDEVEEYVVSSGVENGIIVVQTINNTASVLSLSNQHGDIAKNFFTTMTTLYPLMDGMRFMGHEIKCIRSGLIGTSKSFIVSDSKPVLGAFERIYLADFNGPSDKLVVVMLALKTDVKISEEDNPAAAVAAFKEAYLKEREEEKRREEEAIREMREEWQREHANDPRFNKDKD